MTEQGQNNEQNYEKNRNPSPRLFGDFYEPQFEKTHIVKKIKANSYTIPPTLINLIQNESTFPGLENEDPNVHVKGFFI